MCVHEVALLFKYLDAESLCTERKKKSALTYCKKFMHLPLEGTNKAAFWEKQFWKWQNSIFGTVTELRYVDIACVL